MAYNPENKDFVLTSEKLPIIIKHIIEVFSEIPGFWGFVQTNALDAVGERIKFRECETLSELNKRLETKHGIWNRYYTEEEKQYTRKRWYKNIISICDEFLFYSKPNVISNIDKYDKVRDLEFYERIWFDLKSTKIPKGQKLEDCLKNPESLFEWYYKHQSTGKRYSLNNRLFIAQHSKKTNNDCSITLLTCYMYKSEVFDEYIKKLEDPNYEFIKIEVDGTVVYGDIIFIVEEEDGTFFHKFASDKLN